MEFLFSEDQEQFRENIARFLADRSPTTEVRKLMADDQGYDPEVWSMLSNQLGLCGIAVAEQFGGAGFGPQELAIACEEMGRALYCGPYLASAVCAAYARILLLCIACVRNTVYVCGLDSGPKG